MNIFKRLFVLPLAAVLLGTALCSCADTKPSPVVEVPDEDGWFAAWHSAQLSAGANETPMNPGLKENTCRQQIRVSIGGDKLRITFSNLNGDIPLVIESAHIAHLLDPESSTIDLSTDTVITFNGGETSVTIEAGQELISDEIAFSCEALDDLAITTKFGKFIGGTITSHTASRATTWIAEGDHVLDETMPSGSKEMTSWYYLAEVDVWATAGTKTLICFGDSITDGAAGHTNTFPRYSDTLASLLAEDLDYSNVSVVGSGIGGTVLRGEWGTAGMARLERDVLNVSGAKYVILLYGVNDIGGAQEDISQSIIDTYKSLIELCHAKGIKVYGGTIVPFGGSGYYSELHEEIRIKCNEFIMSENSGFDGYIDFASALADPDDPTKMAAEYNVSAWNDWLHPGNAGYQKMGEVAYEALTALWDAEE